MFRFGNLALISCQSLKNLGKPTVTLQLEINRLNFLTPLWFFFFNQSLLLRDGNTLLLRMCCHKGCCAALKVLQLTVIWSRLTGNWKLVLLRNVRGAVGHESVFLTGSLFLESTAEGRLGEQPCTNKVNGKVSWQRLKWKRLKENWDRWSSHCCLITNGHEALQGGY